MSNLEAAPAELECRGGAPAREAGVLEARDVPLGGPRAMRVRRTLPQRKRSLIGAWCFADHYGPDNVTTGARMDVGPHPHTGLQTVSWLFAGEVEHRDSLGTHARVRPGELNLMTSGHGICHSEVSTPATTVLHGVQLWVALPDAHRDAAPAWQFESALPVHRERHATVTVLLGELAGAVSPGTTYSPLIGADVDLSGELVLPLEPDFEHAVLVMAGSATADGTELTPGTMLYLGCSRRELRMTSDRARLMLLGGEPFAEQIVMWWNFVARSNEEIVAARHEWMSGAAFGDVAGYDGYRLPAPPLPPGRLRPGGAVR